MSRRLLVLIHGYIAVFFLPFALLYAITGGLYILGESGGDTRSTVSITTSTPPSSAGEAISLMQAELSSRGWRVPTATDPYRELQGGYYWGHFSETLRFAPSKTEGQWDIIHQQNSWYRQLVEIHKDHAGLYFSIMGFGFAIGMFVLILSGAFMMFQSKVHRKMATILVVVGIVFTSGAWLLSV